MRILSFSGATLAGIGLAVASIVPSVTNAESHRGTFARAYLVRARPPMLRPHSNVATPTPQTCNSNHMTYSFVGMPSGEFDYAYGLDSAVVAGYQNGACADYSDIAGGQDNIIGYTQGPDSFVGAGQANAITAYNSAIVAGEGNIVSGENGFVGAGWANYVSGYGSAIGGGDYTYYNFVSSTTPGNQISGTDSFIGAGDQNVVAANDAFVGAGDLNNVTSTAGYSVLGGGYQNTLSGQKAVLGGGESNQVAGSFAVVPGGYHDEALGNESFAAGSQAEAKFTGSFVWSDYVSGESALNDSANDEFVARASGGVYFFSNAGKTSGVHLAAGSGTWASLSDRNAKTDVVPLDDASILSKVASLPISAWRYKTESGVRHVGPMAQDFYAAFGVGEDDRHITSIDEDGVALAAIKALHSENRELRRDGERKASEIAQLRNDDLRKEGEVARLRASVATLAAKDSALERRFDLLAASVRSDR